MKKRLILLLHVSLFINFILAQSTNDIVFNYGPKNKTDQKFVTLYIIRPDDTLDKKRWYAVMYEEISLGVIENNSKIQIKFPLDGKQRFWTQFNSKSPTSGVWAELKYSKSYYLKLQIRPGQDHANPELLLLDSINGKREFDKITGNTRTLFYPVPPDIPESMLVGNPFNRNTLIPYYYNNTDSFYYWRFRFKAPSFFQYIYISKHVYQFGYENKVLSPTYSELLQVSGSAVKEIRSEEDLLNQLKKRMGGKGMKSSKKEKLVSLNYEPIKAFGDFGWMAISEVEVHNAGNKGENDFLLLREIRAVIYKKTEKTKIAMAFWYSSRGTPEESYTLDEMKERLKQFLNGWELKTDIKTDELPAETDKQDQ
jgi:hypothetical protein